MNEPEKVDLLTQQEIDRLTARLRGYETNREYWTRYSWTQPPFDVDKYMTGQVNLISKHVKLQPGELVYPSLFVELWRACWNGVNLQSAWHPYSTNNGLVFEAWLELPHRQDAGNDAVRKGNVGRYAPSPLYPFKPSS